MWDRIAEFFSRLLPESFLRGLIDRFTRQLESRAPGAWAKDLLKTALVLIILGLLVDAWLYWSQKERRALLARRFQAVAAFFRRAAYEVRRLWRKACRKIKARLQKPDPEAEARAQAEASSFSKLMVLDAQLEEAEQNLTEMLGDQGEVPHEAGPVPETAEPVPQDPRIPGDYVPAKTSTRRRPLPDLEEEPILPEEAPAETDAQPFPAEDGIPADHSGFGRKDTPKAPDPSLPSAEDPEPPLTNAERFWNTSEGPKS